MSLVLAQPAWLAPLIAIQSLEAGRALLVRLWCRQMQVFGVISIIAMPDRTLRCGSLCCCRGIPVLAHLEGAVRQQVWDLMQRRPCQAGEIIIEQASWGRAAWPDHWAALMDCCLASCTAQPWSGFSTICKHCFVKSQRAFPRGNCQTILCTPSSQQGHSTGSGEGAFSSCLPAEVPLLPQQSCPVCVRQPASDVMPWAPQLWRH